jgi:hypothetical protein
MKNQGIQAELGGKVEYLKEYHKKYQVENNEKIQEYNKKYQVENKQKIQAYRAKYHDENKVKIHEKHKQYRDENKEKRSERHICACGGHYTIDNKSRHQSSKKHLNFFKIDQ